MNNKVLIYVLLKHIIRGVMRLLLTLPLYLLFFYGPDAVKDYQDIRSPIFANEL